MSSAVLAVTIAFCGCAGVYLAAIVKAMRGQLRCPACGERKLVMKRLVRGHEWPPPSGTPIDETIYQCGACGGEFGREGGGALIPKHAFEAGAREPLATARALPPKEP